MRLLVAADRVDIDSRDSYGWTPLSKATEGGNEAVVRLLLATGKIDVESRDNEGWTPLSRAAGGGHEAVVRCLEQLKQNRHSAAIPAQPPQ